MTALVISHDEMHTAASHGRGSPLTDQIPEFRRYHGSWWVTSPDGWLRITDTHLAACLDTIKTRLDIAEDNAACERDQWTGSDPGGKSLRLKEG